MPPHQVLSSNWREELQEYIAPDQLPKEYGGTNPAPLPDPPGPWRDPAIVEKVRLEIGGGVCGAEPSVCILTLTTLQGFHGSHTPCPCCFRWQP